MSTEVTGAEELSATSCSRGDAESLMISTGGWTKAVHCTHTVILGDVDGGALGGMVGAAVLSGAEEEAYAGEASKKHYNVHVK